MSQQHTRGGGFRCADCGHQVPRWVGRCPDCRAWGSVRPADRPAGSAAVAGLVPARAITELDGAAARARPTGVAELDRVLGGGLVPGSVVLLAGEPGIGKSTLLLDVAARAAGPGRRSLLVTAEESAAQVRARAERVGALCDHLYLAAETDLAAVLEQVCSLRPALLVVDSVQTVTAPTAPGAAGGVAQVREVTASLVRVAKRDGIATLLVGHVTKDGAVAGPRLLEHLVDVVLHFDGERHSRLRLVRAVKNRFGATDEVGCFDLDEDGISGLADPSGLFLSRAGRPVPGTCVTVLAEGRRAMAAEVQALVGPAAGGPVRRACSGLDPARVAMVLAVLDRRGGLRLHDRDVYTATVGGVRVGEPACDLAVALAVAGARVGGSVPPGTVAVGEVGLTGEIRPVPGVRRRLTEAGRLGFHRALVPPQSGPPPEGVTAVEVGELAVALRQLADG